jgi:hypothetical protein
VAVANWPIALVDFAIESLYKLTLAVPIVGGALMAAVLLGADVRVIAAEGVRAAADLVMGSLGGAPAALAAFLAALGIVALGGAMLMYVVKAGTLAVIAGADAAAGEFHRHPITSAALRRASVCSLETILTGALRFGRRMVTLTAWLGAAYLLVVLVFVATLALPSILAGTGWMRAWPILMLVVASGSVVAIALINLVFDLLRVIVVTDDCRTREAWRRLRSFVIEDARQVLGIFAVTTAALAVAAAASLSAVASVTLVAWVPVAGLIVVPLQLLAWVVRGLLLQGVSLTTLAAYQTQYRRFAGSRRLTPVDRSRWEEPA